MKSLIVLVSIYLIYCIYKFVLLFIHYKHINEIPDSDFFGITVVNNREDKLSNVSYKSSIESIIFGGIEFKKQYLEYTDSYQNSFKTLQIYYKNKDKNQNFHLIYDEKTNKFVYDKNITADEEEMENYTFATREISKNHFLDSNAIGDDTPIMIYMLKASINPSIIVTQDYIKYIFKDGYRKVEIDNVDGRIYSDYTLTDTLEDIISYDYSWTGYDFQKIDTVKDLGNLLGVDIVIEN